MDEAGRKKLCARVNANMQMNEHILEEQTHIWKLIIQHADFFFTCGDALFYHILFYARSIAIRSYSNRELLVDVISLVAAFYTRKQKSHVPTSEEYQSQLHINTHMLNTMIKVLLFTAINQQEQLLFKRCCDLVNTVLSLNPQQPINLNDFDRPSLLAITDPSKRLTSEQVYALSMPIIVSFRITAMSLPYFKVEFIEKNAENLSKRVDCIMNYIQYNYIFCSLIELLPGSRSPSSLPIELFSVPLPYSATTQTLLSTVKESLFRIFKKDIALITVASYKRSTRVWRVLYLIQCIIERTPSVLPFFVSDLLICCDQVHRLFREFASDPQAQRSLYGKEIDESCAMWVSLRSMTNRPDAAQELGMPPMPVLRGSEVVYSLLLLIKLFLRNLSLLDKHHRVFIAFLCQFFRTVQRAELLTYVLDLISEIVKEENSFFTLEDIKQLLISTKEIRSTQESVLYIGIITSYWQFQYYLCERYVVSLSSLDL